MSFDDVDVSLRINRISERNNDKQNYLIDTRYLCFSTIFTCKKSKNVCLYNFLHNYRTYESNKYLLRIKITSFIAS